MRSVLDEVMWGLLRAADSVTRPISDVAYNQVWNNVWEPLTNLISIQVKGQVLDELYSGES